MDKFCNPPTGEDDESRERYSEWYNDRQFRLEIDGDVHSPKEPRTIEQQVYIAAGFARALRNGLPTLRAHGRPTEWHERRIRRYEAFIAKCEVCV